MIILKVRRIGFYGSILKVRKIQGVPRNMTVGMNVFLHILFKILKTFLQFISLKNLLLK